MMSLLSLFAADSGSIVTKLLGRLHPAVVHFPIALVTVAAVLETWQIVRRKSGLSPATPVCLVLGALSAIVATVFGICRDHRNQGLFEIKSWTTTDIHKWIGIGATVVALVAVVLLIKAAQSPTVLLALRACLFGGAAAIGAAGYFGGDIVFGENHLFAGLFEEKPTTPVLAVASSGDPPDLKVAGSKTGPVDKPDFIKDVAPILKDNCFRCHGGEKVKGKFNLKNHASVLKGGASGDVLVPGQPDKSPLYTLLLETDPDSKMPPPKEKQQLTAAQIETIRKWVAQGAEWPEAFEIN